MPADIKDRMLLFYEEVMDHANLAAIDDLCAPDFVEHAVPPGVALAQGVEGLRDFVAMFHGAFSDVHVEVHDVLAEDDIAAARITIHCRHTGDFMGLPPTGRAITWNSVDWMRFEGDKAAEHWALDDTLTVLQQMGVLGGATGNGNGNGAGQ